MAARAEPAPDDLLLEAVRVLERNTREVRRDGTTYRFSIPAADAYPFQWFWDSCFHAVVWSRVDRERAADELRSLLAWQRPSGFIPHVIFWDTSRVAVSQFWHYVESRGIPWVRVPQTTECVQPPVLAQAVERIGGDFVRETLPALAAYYRFLADNRDPDGDGLVSVVSGFESGLDYSPAFDGEAVYRNPVSMFLAARRGEITNRLLAFDFDKIFRWTDHHAEGVLFNVVYADGLATLARLAAPHDVALARWASTTAGRVTAALLERCWDDGAGLFFNATGRDEHLTRRATVSSLLPLLLPDLPRDVAARLVERLRDPRTFWTPFPVASVARDDPSFTRTSRIRGVRFIWRGPVSLNTNWFLVEGLRRHGFGGEADVLAERSRDLVRAGGFNEFYDPIDGTPVGAPDFGWATLAADL